MRGVKGVKRTIVITGIAVVLIVAVTIVFISPITKYLVEKYDEKYTGRQIKMDWAYVNPFTGYVYLKNIKVFECQSDTVFFSARGLGVNFSWNKLFSKTYEISRLSVNEPRIVIVQNNKDFNFNDLIQKFASDTTDTIKEPVRFNILNVKINNGEVHYREEIIPVYYFIEKFNFESSGKKWDVDTVSCKISFASGIGSGDIKGDFSVNLQSLDYRLAAWVNKFDLTLTEQYLKELAAYGSFRARVDADITATGNLKDRENVNASGMLAINDFHFGKNPKEDYVSYDKLVLRVNELSPKDHKYLIDSISLSHPFFKYEKYDYLNNIETMFGKDGANVKAVAANPERYNLIIETARYVRILAKNFFKSDYKIKRLAVYKGDIRFNDYSLSEKFSTGLSPLYILADSISKDRKRVEVILNSGIRPYGDMSIVLSVNPKDSSDFEMDYHFKKIPAAMANPYLISYTSFPLDRGTIEFNGKWQVRNGMIKSDNHMLVVDPRTSKRVKNKDVRWIPASLVMSLVRERSNVIDYEIPISGNLKDPKFHFRDVIFDLLGNIFIKPPTTPYRMQVRSTETEIEKFLTLKWNMRQTSLSSDQEKFVKKIADFLVENPEAHITVDPVYYAEKEKEYIAFFEAKKKYFLSSNNQPSVSFGEPDSLKVDRMSIKDSLFVDYLNDKLRDSLLFTIQEKCWKYIGSNTIDQGYVQLNVERKKKFISYFRERHVENRVKIEPGKSSIPYNGFSFYKIHYKGEFPESLVKAYEEMNDLNSKPPREKFRKVRERTPEYLK